MKKITCEICGEQFSREEICYVSLIDYPTFGDAVLCCGCLDVLADGLIGARDYYLRSCALGYVPSPIIEEMTEQNMWDILLYGDQSWANDQRRCACFYFTTFPDWLNLAKDCPDGEIVEWEICPDCGLLFFTRCNYDECKNCPLDGHCWRGGFSAESCRNCGALNPWEYYPSPVSPEWFKPTEQHDIDNAMKIAEFFVRTPDGLGLIFFLHDKGSQTEAAIAKALGEQIDVIVEAEKLGLVKVKEIKFTIIGEVPPTKSVEQFRDVTLTEKGKIIVERLRAKKKERG